MAKRVCVAQIGAPHGVRGEVRLWTFTADPMAVARYGALESEDGKRSFEIEKARQAKDHLVARLRGIGDRETAERLTNTKLFVARERLPEIESDEFYHTDLIGLRVEDEGGNEIGAVIAMHNFGAGDILEIQPLGGGAMMLPFTETVVPEVDLKGGRLVVVLPEETVVPEEKD
ncbi:MAG: rRNA processing protein RimM [Alphaproteobacteria bacterium]|jgi:16S rRNA processing protein RimM|nr:rRNA processing protein RimM [Alphaproteobacteria bacterium]